MANIADLFRAILPQQPGGSEMFTNRGARSSLDADPQGAARGADIVLRSLLEQLQSLPSAAPEGVRPDAALDTFLFNLDPRGEFNQQDRANRAARQQVFGESL